jgi:hypothetical protein
VEELAMNKGSGDKAEGRGECGEGGGAVSAAAGPGAEGTEFLDLEISRVLHGRAQSMARGAAEEIIRDAIKARLKERIGAQLEALGRIVGDELADDIEANLEIEARIAARRELRESGRGQLDELFFGRRDRPESK